MQKIIINGRFLLHKVTGVERYAREMIAELDKIADGGKVMMAVPPELDEIPKYENIKVIKVGKLHNRLWEHISFPLFVYKNKGISLNLCNVAPLIKPGIVCMHDVKIKAKPEYFQKKFLLWYNLLFSNQIKRADMILTVSEFSKLEILRYYNVDKNKIHVVPSAWQHFKNIKFDENTLKKYNLKKQAYYFSMCSLEPNKNFKWIAEVAKKNTDELFVVAGAINKEIFSEGLGFECPTNMKLIGYVSDEEAKTLMRDSTAFLFPTFYEGFGLPPLEAMSTGVEKVIVSDIPVMHEIYGDSVYYINPYFPEENIKQLISQKVESSDKVLSNYGWDKSAIILKKIIADLTGEK